MKLLVSLASMLAAVAAFQIEVEPLVFLMAACNSARQTVTPQLMQEKMERTYTAPENLTGKNLKKFYNKKMVYWDQYYEYINMPLSCILGILYGAYSDYMGRKLPLLIGMASVAVDTAFHMLVLGPSVDLSLYFLLVDAFFTAFMGNFSLFMSACNAYMADTFPVKKTLSKRMVIVSVSFSAGALSGSSLTRAVVKHLSPIKVMLISQCCVSLAVLYALAVIKVKEPGKKSLLTDQGEEHPEIRQQKKFISPLHVFKNSIKSFADSVKIFLVPREGHRRCFLYLTILVAFLDQFVFGEEKSLIGTYTRLPPFNWKTEDYALYKTIRSINRKYFSKIFWMFFGLLVFKQFLKLTDTMIIVLSILSMGLCGLVVGLAQKSWQIYVSIPIGGLHGLLNPLTLTFISCLVNADEVGKAFAVNSIGGKLAGIAQNAILNNIYTATIVWWQGFVWVLMAGISVVAALIILVIHFVAKREKIGA
ncbi:unnamed protein product [Enterobius vermicularis]|uniref:MFS domain-containing protein n=1 Tax=Enterobius vermicularis TaxID=51028 RepID=A0A158Q9G6_ENTVE|nr:unnamed protein product [Enterobius vermicularis]